MEKIIFEEMSETYHAENGYLIPNLTAQRRKAHRDMGTATFAASQTEPEIVFYKFADKWKAK